ncbi:MAG: CoA-binding protein [Desulfobacterales bacterium]
MVHTNHFLQRFFNPESVAIVGATNNPLKMNFRVLQNLVHLEYEGKIYPVNPNTSEILGIKTFARLQDIPESIDLAVIAVPANKVPGIIRECGSKGVENIVIITGGFSEGGESGMKLQKEMKSLIKKNRIRILGPNTLSPINTANKFAISFNPIKRLSRGNISFAFQSGFYEPMINWLFSHLGINKILDMGNKMDINELDALEYFAEDPDTGIIAMHIESLHGDGRKFFNRVKYVSKGKPVIILKAGRTQAGSRAAASHTGTMASENDAVFDGALRQAGAVRAETMEAFFDLAKAFQFCTLPRGNRLAIVTLSGGEGVMATDACETHGMNQADLGPETSQKLERIFPEWEIPLNPFDAGVCMEFHLSDLAVFFDTLRAIPEDNGVDCTIMQLLPWTLNENMTIPGTSENFAGAMRELYIQWLLSMKKSGKPFALWCASSGATEMALIGQIEAERIPVFRSSERAVRALSAMDRYRERKFHGK